jgi:hypothetical protein
MEFERQPKGLLADVGDDAEKDLLPDRQLWYLLPDATVGGSAHLREHRVQRAHRDVGWEFHGVPP